MHRSVEPDLRHGEFMHLRHVPSECGQGLGQIGQAYGSFTSEVVGAVVILVLVLVAACKETRTGSVVVGNGPE